VSGETIPVLSNPINDTTICSNEEFVVSVPVNNSTSILWNDGSIQYQRTFANANDYTYQLFNICGQAVDSFKIVVEHPLEFGLGNDTVICYGEEFDKVLNYPNHTFLWNSGETDNFRTITRTGVYGVTIWTAAHCESYDEFEVTACTTQLFNPNAFTPGNGDDLNNTFKIKGVGIRAFQIVIYDRWGQQVFESTDLDNSWDGTSRASVSTHSHTGASSSSAPAGVYTYKIWYNLGDDKNRISKVGVVNLIR
jgi:gliding motility-associated-like protein